MYSDIISSRPHHACDVTLATIFSYEKIHECKRDGDVAGVTPAAAAGNSRGPRKETCKYYNKRKSVVQCAEAAMTVTARYWTLGCGWLTRSIIYNVTAEYKIRTIKWKHSDDYKHKSLFKQVQVYEWKAG